MNAFALAVSLFVGLERVEVEQTFLRLAKAMPPDLAARLLKMHPRIVVELAYRDFLEAKTERWWPKRNDPYWNIDDKPRTKFDHRPIKDDPYWSIDNRR